MRPLDPQCKHGLAMPENPASNRPSGAIRRVRLLMIPPIQLWLVYKPGAIMELSVDMNGRHVARPGTLGQIARVPPKLGNCLISVHALTLHLMRATDAHDF